jgi:hypothetical protein
MPASSKEKGDVIILKSLLATNAQRKWLNVWKHYWSKFIPKKKRLTNKNTMCMCLDTKIELKFNKNLIINFFLHALVAKMFLALCLQIGCLITAVSYDDINHAHNRSAIFM